jgi:cytochrome P450
MHLGARENPGWSRRRSPSLRDRCATPDEDQRQSDRQRAACRQPRSGGHRAGRRLDITRTDNPHLVFGHGIHHCRGAPLAQLESRIALGSLPSRFPQLGLAVPAEQLMYRPGVLMNALTTLPVILR